MSSGGSFRYGTSSNAAAEVAVVRALYSAFARRDVAAAIPYLDESFELLPTGTRELTGRPDPYRGPEGMRQYLGDVERVWSELELVADDIRAISGSVIVFGHVRGTPRGTDLVIERRVLWTWKLRDGRADLAARQRRRLKPTGRQSIATITSRRVPRGASKATSSPTAHPASAWASGDSTLSLPSAGSDSLALTSSCVLSRPLSASRTVTSSRADASAPAVGLDDHRAAAALLQAQDLRLQVRLGVLGVVVLGVLLEVAPRARGLDPLGHLAAALALELGQLGLERHVGLARHLVAEVLAHGRLTVAIGSAKGGRSGRR